MISIELEYRILPPLSPPPPSHLHPALPAKWMLLGKSHHFALTQATCQDQPKKLERSLQGHRPTHFFASPSTFAGVGCISCVAVTFEPALPLAVCLLQGHGAPHGTAFARWPVVQLQLRQGRCTCCPINAPVPKYAGLRTSPSFTGASQFADRQLQLLPIFQSFHLS